MTKTAGIKALVEEVLASGTNWTDDVILEVFVAIERTSAWHHRYAALCQSLGIDLVNKWGGRYVRLALGRPRKLGRTRAGASSLIDSYTILDSSKF